MKKNIFVLLITFLASNSCDPGSTVSIYIENSRDIDGIVTFYESEESMSDTSYIIYANSKTLIGTNSGLGEDVILEIISDSIEFVFGDETFIRYYKDSVSDKARSIYRESDWDKIEIDRKEFEYFYTIADEDVSTNNVLFNR